MNPTTGVIIFTSATNAELQQEINDYLRQNLDWELISISYQIIGASVYAACAFKHTV